MFPQEVIRLKRDGHVLTSAQIDAFVGGITDDSVCEGQVAAFAMAVFFRGMTPEECVALTRAMTHSGATLDWSSCDLPGPRVDKHSTGGVGDKVSLILAPLLAACGAYVPMIAGRGLGHTGGTLDKLEAIPGFDVHPSRSAFQATVARIGCAIAGATADLAPADRRMYAIRDITATVESVPLITASILSKKIAASLDHLVLDVKFGSGAFASTLEVAQDLARSLVDVGSGAGLPTTALLTDMNEVLGHAAGNAVETREAIDALTEGRAEPRLEAIVLALGAELLVAAQLCPDHASADRALRDAWTDGEAAERFARMVAASGGPHDILARPDALLPDAPVVRDVFSPRRGYLCALDVREVGVAIVELGGGRAAPTDAIDPAVGLDRFRSLGAEVGPDSPLCRIHARTEHDAERGAQRLLNAVTVSDAPPANLADPVVQRLSRN